MRAINYYIVVKPCKKEEINVGGLLLTEKTDKDNRYLKGEIITTGNLVEGIDVGDIVYYDKAAGHGIRWDDNEYKVIKAQDVVLVE
jgi:co-chaperonin GroES (HSP10)